MDNISNEMGPVFGSLKDGDLEAQEELNLIEKREGIVSGCQNLNYLAMAVEKFGDFKSREGKIRSGTEQSSLIKDITRLVDSGMVKVNNKGELNMYLNTITMSFGIRTKVEKLIKELVVVS